MALVGVMVDAVDAELQCPRCGSQCPRCGSRCCASELREIRHGQSRALIQGMLLHEAPQGGGFVREGFEDGVELGDVEDFGDAALGVQQLDLAALVGDAGIGTDKFAEAGAIHVGNLRKVEEQLGLPGLNQVLDCGADQGATFAESDAARQVYDRDVACVTNGGFAAHDETSAPLWTIRGGNARRKRQTTEGDRLSHWGAAHLWPLFHGLTGSAEAI